MEGVGARLGRSSTRYGPATVFTGPVRKWRKKWVHVTPSNGAPNHHAQSHTHNHHHNANNTTNSNGTINGNNPSHLLLYKWTPTSQSHSSSNGNTTTTTLDKSSGKDDVLEEPPRRKFKYIPIAVLEEQKDEAMDNESEEKVEDEEKLGAGEMILKDTNLDEKPDINDVPMEESQEKMVRQDLNESTLDLSLNLNARDDESESGSKADHK